MRSKRGITLVSLVVTIIVLIILAGVSINLTLGENGIITMAKRSRENMELAQIDEQTKLNNLYDQIVAEGGVAGNPSNVEVSKLAEFKREIASALTDIGIATEENADVSTMASSIRSLTGEISADKVSYDNTNSELESTNVQGAVDELDGKVDELNDGLTATTEVYNSTTHPSMFGSCTGDITIRKNKYSATIYLHLLLNNGVSTSTNSNLVQLPLSLPTQMIKNITSANGYFHALLYMKPDGMIQIRPTVLSVNPNTTNDWIGEIITITL